MSAGNYRYSLENGGFAEIHISRITNADLPDLVEWLRLVVRQYERMYGSAADAPQAQEQSNVPLV